MKIPDHLPAADATLNQRLQFLMLADRLKTVERRTFVSDASRHENSAEHSWHLALAVMLFAPLARERDLNVAHAIELALVHDLVEIEAGDTYVYDATGRETQQAREQQAAAEIFGLLPAEQNARLRAAWDEFEELQTPEAQFVRALDRMLPILLNFATNGRAWIAHQISAQQVRDLNLPALDAIPALKTYCEALIEEAKNRGFLRAETGNLED